MLWVKHDTAANQDAKLQNVLLDYGLEGYGLYWYCIELIAGKVDKNNYTFQLEHDARIIARNTGSTPQKVEEMMRYFVKTGLFENSTGVITCLKLAKRLDQSMVSNPQMREIISNLKRHDSVMTESENPMQEEKRLEENRIEEKKEVKPIAPQLDYQEILTAYNECLTNSSGVHKITPDRKKKVKKFFDEFGLDVEKFKLYLGYINDHPDCKWMFEKRPKNDGSGQSWQPCKFEYFISEKCYLNVKENL